MMSVLDILCIQIAKGECILHHRVNLLCIRLYDCSEYLKVVTRDYNIYEMVLLWDGNMSRTVGTVPSEI